MRMTESKWFPASAVLIVVQSLSRVWLSATPWTAERQAFWSLTISQSWLKFTSIELVMPSNHPRVALFSNPLPCKCDMILLPWLVYVLWKRWKDFIGIRWPVQVRCIKQGTHSKPVNWDSPEGCDGEGGGRGFGLGTRVHPWLTHVNAWQKPPQYCKVISLQLK